jgi:hypothetical protein
VRRFNDESSYYQNPYWAMIFEINIDETSRFVVISICHMTSTKSSISLLVLVQIALGEMVKTGELHKHTTRFTPAAGAISSF